MKKRLVIGLAVMIAFLFVGTLPFPQSSDNEHKASIDTTGYVGQGWSMPASGWSHPGPDYPDWPANWRVLNVSTICDIDYNPGASMIAFHDINDHLQAYVRGDKAAHGFDWEMNSSITDVVIWSDMGHTWVLDYTMYEQFPVFEAPIDQDNLTTNTVSYSKLFTSNRTVSNYTILATNASWVDIRLYNSTTVELYGTPPLRDKIYTYYVNFSVNGSGETWMNYTLEVDPNPPTILKDESHIALVPLTLSLSKTDVLTKTSAFGTWPPTTNVTTNYNAYLTFGADNNYSGGNYIKRSFMSFDSSSIPDDAVVQDVTLYLFPVIGAGVSTSKDWNLEICSAEWGNTLNFNAWNNISRSEAIQPGTTWMEGYYDNAIQGYTMSPDSINKTGLSQFILKIQNDDNAPNGTYHGSNAVAWAAGYPFSPDNLEVIPYLEIRYSIGYHDNARNWSMIPRPFTVQTGWGVLENYSGTSYDTTQQYLFAGSYGSNDRYRAYMTFDLTNIPRYTVFVNASMHIDIGYIGADSDFDLNLYKANFGTFGTEDWNTPLTFVCTLLNTSSTGVGWVNVSLPDSVLIAGTLNQFVLKISAEGFSGEHYIQTDGSAFQGWPVRLRISANFTAPDTVYEHSNYFYYPEANQTIDSWGITTNATTMTVVGHNDTAGVVHWHPNNLNAGRYYVVNVSYTNQNGTGYEEFRVSVLNIKPVFTSTPTLSGKAGSEYTYNSNVDEKSEGGVYTGIRTNYVMPYGWDNGNGKLKIPSPAPGTFWFNISFDDQSHTDNATTYQNFTLVFTQGAAAELIVEFSFQINGANVTFHDESRGAIQTWYWQFGDGTTSMQRNPKHVYEQSGTYEVTLVVMDGFGNSLQVKHSLVVEKKVTALVVPQSFLVPLVAIILIGAGMLAIKNKFAALIGIALIVVVLILWLMGLMPVTNVGW